MFGIVIDKMIISMLDGNDPVVIRKEHPRNKSVASIKKSPDSNAIFVGYDSAGRGVETYMPDYHIGDIVFGKEKWRINSQLGSKNYGAVEYYSDYPESAAELMKWCHPFTIPLEYIRYQMRVTDIHAELIDGGFHFAYTLVKHKDGE